jgi:hypothetical protein
MNEKTRLTEGAKQKDYFVLTRHSEESSSGGKRNAQRRRPVSTELYHAQEEAVAERQCAPRHPPQPHQAPRRPLLADFALQPLMGKLADERLLQAHTEGDPAPVIMAFTLVESCHYRNVARVAEFEASTEYREQPEPGRAQAISDDQLCVDMQYCKTEFKGVCAMLLHLRAQCGLYVLLERRPYKQRNTESDWLDRFLLAPYLQGHYYKVIVDFSRSEQ